MLCFNKDSFLGIKCHGPGRDQFELFQKYLFTSGYYPQDYPIYTKIYPKKQLNYTSQAFPILKLAKFQALILRPSRKQCRKTNTKGSKLCFSISPIIIHQDIFEKKRYGQKSASYMKLKKLFWFFIMIGRSGFLSRGYTR